MLAHNQYDKYSQDISTAQQKQMGNGTVWEFA